MTNLDEIDPTFVEDLKASEVARAVARDWLARIGYPVIFNHVRIRPHVDQRHDFSDNGDLKIVQTVEVKQRPEIEFTSAEDFPYPTIIVDKCRLWDRARPKPWAHIIFDADLSHACIVPGETRDRWVREERYFGGRHQDVYEVDVRECWWIPIERTEGGK